MAWEFSETFLFVKLLFKNKSTNEKLKKGGSVSRTVSRLSTLTEERKNGVDSNKIEFNLGHSPMRGNSQPIIIALAHPENRRGVPYLLTSD